MTRATEDALRRETDVLRKMLDERRRDPGDYPVTGCGDNSCVVESGRGGMGTNGGCQCDARALRRAIQWWKRRAAFLEETIRIDTQHAAEDERARIVAWLRREACGPMCGHGECRGMREAARRIESGEHDVDVKLMAKGTSTIGE